MQMQAMQRKSGWTNSGRQCLMHYEKLSGGRNPVAGGAMAGWAAMMKASKAPGAPGSAPTWTTSAKDMVTTALGNSRVWVTLGYGIVNEVYWPATGTPQIRDLGFIVAGPSGWFEVKRVARYQVSWPETNVLLPQFIHEGEGYRLVLEVTPDPLRDVALVSFRLTGEDVRLYVLLAPHLSNSGEGNNARAGDDLVGWKGEHALCLVSDCSFSRSSAGYVGVSDGWQDFARNGRMTWTYGEATEGNVALLGELRENEGTLGLGFSETVEGARTLARSSLGRGYAAIRRRFIDGWREWQKTLTIPEAPAQVRREAFVSAIILKIHEDRTYPGSVVASLSVPWGNSSDSSGGYHLVWARDCVEAGLALFACGQVSDTRRMMSYLVATQTADGRWYQNTFPDGRPFWTGIQLDEVAFPVILAAKLAEENALVGLGGIGPMVRSAARYILHNGPITPQDRWEENAGFSPFTLAVEIAALIGAAEFLEGEERSYALSVADYWNERIEDWTYVVGGAFAARFGVSGYYVRIGPPPAEGGLRGRVTLANRGGESVPADTIVGLEFLHLVRLGLRAATDPRIQNTCRVTEALLRVDTPNGAAYHRYNDDGYGEHADGSPFDGSGIGRAWPLLTGERGHFEVQLGRDPLAYLEAMTRMAGATGLIPEQVWDSAPLPARGLEPGKPTGGAMPLVWAHAEFLKLVCARQDKRPLEMLKCVERHYRQPSPRSGRWHWRRDVPFDAIPKDRELLIEMPAPFLLHLGFDGWHGIEDRRSMPLAFGWHGVTLTRNELARREVLDFTFYLIDAARWEGRDYHVRLAVSEKSEAPRKREVVAPGHGDDGAT
jgi:glucoamylase